MNKTTQGIIGRWPVLLSLSLLLCSLSSMAQDPFQEVFSDDEKQILSAAFMAPRIVNLESEQTVGRHNLIVTISHRFGTVKNGIDDFFGLDFAVTRLALDYGITDTWMVGLGRSGYMNTYDFNTKYNIWRQRKDGFPLSVSGYHQIGLNTAEKGDDLMGFEFKHKVSYFNQILLTSKISKAVSLELAPSYLHQNLVEKREDSNDQFVLAAGGRVKVSRNIAINADYFHNFNASSRDQGQVFSIGMDLETGGHVFQLHFCNSQAINAVNIANGGNGKWTKGDIFFGFNLTRVFPI